MIISIFDYRKQQDGGDYEYEDVSSLLREYEEEFIPHRQVQTSSSAPGANIIARCKHHHQHQAQAKAGTSQHDVPDIKSESFATILVPQQQQQQHQGFNRRNNKVKLK